MTETETLATDDGTSTPATPDTVPTAAPKRRRRGILGRKSSVIGHPDQSRIERDLALGVPLSRISRKFGISKDAAWRHGQKLPPQLKAALAGHALAPGQDLEKIRVVESESLLANLASQRARLLHAQDQAFEAEQLSLVAQLGSGIHRNLELVGKYLGEFASHTVHTQISILVSEEYLTLRGAMLSALGPYAEARRAVAAELHRIEAAAAQRPAMPVIEHVKEAAHAE